MNSDFMNDCEKYKIKFFPCGLPDIDGNHLYDYKEKDKVQELCVKLGRHEICTLKLVGECANYINQK